jgi:2-methylcitrate dehydratase PrpD
MNLRALAEALLDSRCARDTIDLHVKDTLAAFFVGAATAEGNALARFYGSGTDRAERAAAAAGIARLSECDDIHLASCVTPGAVVIPVALAFAESDTDKFYRAVAAGYAAGLRLGIAIGGAKALAAGTWPTLLAAPLMAAVTACICHGHNADQLAHAMALALAGGSGRLGGPSGQSSARWVRLAEAVMNGLRASQAAGEGARGDVSLVSRSWLAGAVGHDDVELAALDPCGSVPSVADVGFKPFPIARQAQNAVFAFQRLLQKGIAPSRIDAIDVFVPSTNVSLLSRPLADDDRLSRLCNIGYQLAAAALAPGLLDDVERTPGADIPLTEFARRVSVKPSVELDAHLPHRWAATVTVVSRRDRSEETVIRTPFDHDADNLAHALGEKWRRLLSADRALFLDKVAKVGPSALWQMIERHVSMLAKPGSHG